MNAMTRAYLEAALWTSELDASHTLNDFAPEALSQAEQDCEAFAAATIELRNGWAAVTDSQAGHDFWLTRNRHGTGFWDRGLGEVGTQLTDIAHAFGGSDVYVGDDGKAYLS